MKTLKIFTNAYINLSFFSVDIIHLFVYIIDKHINT